MAINKHPLDGQAGTYVGLGQTPDDAGTILQESESEKAGDPFYWIGVEVVQKRNVRTRINPKTDEEELVFKEDPEKWDSPIYIVLQKSITMPRLGEIIYLDGWTAARLLEQIPPNCLMTAKQGGDMIAEYLKEQIEKGVPLPELTRGAFKLDRQPEKVTLNDVLSNVDEKQIREALLSRNLGHMLSESEDGNIEEDED